jgi:hypothetical protein
MSLLTPAIHDARRRAHCHFATNDDRLNERGTKCRIEVTDLVIGGQEEKKQRMVEMLKKQA